MRRAATESRARPTSCPRSGWSRTRRRCSALAPGSGRTEARKRARAADGARPWIRTAVLRIRTGTGYGLRRKASSKQLGKDGWDLVEAPFSDAGWYADYIASFGAAVVVVEPVDLREAVIRRLKSALT